MMRGTYVRLIALCVAAQTAPETARMADGFYWTATESDPGGGFYYNFGKGGLALHRQSGGEKQRAFSVRCIRN